MYDVFNQFTERLGVEHLARHCSGYMQDVPLIIGRRSAKTEADPMLTEAGPKASSNWPHRF